MTDTTAEPSPRRVSVRRSSALAAIVAGGLFAAGWWFWDWPYLLMLFLSFVFWLGIGHWWLCRNLWVTQWHVRLIDYHYLSAAAVSILLAATQYQDDRTRYAQMLDDVFVPNNKAGLEAFLDGELKTSCAVPDSFVPTQFCDWLKQLRPFFDSSYSRADLEARIDEAGALLAKEQWDSWWVTLGIFATYGEGSGPRRNMVDINSPQGRQRLALEMQQSAGRAVRFVIRSMEKIAVTQFNPPNTVVAGKQPEGFIPAIKGLGKTVAWPFLLIFALGIRFIKVTAEVSGWAKS